MTVKVRKDVEVGNGLWELLNTFVDLALYQIYNYLGS